MSNGTSLHAIPYHTHVVELATPESPLSTPLTSRSDFTVLKLIGTGGFAKVYLVQHIITNQLYAMKVMNKVIKPKLKKSQRKELPPKAQIYIDGMNELEILASLFNHTQQHPFLVSLRFAFHDEFHLYLILDWAPGGELFSQITTNGICLEDHVVFYVAEILLALEHLHSLNIIYRDLKLENVLIDRSGHIKLTDFGLAKFGISDEFQISGANTWCGTYGYMAPEMVKKHPYDEKVDTWGLGILCYLMLTGTGPFEGPSRMEVERRITSRKPKFPYYITREATMFMTQALTKDPMKRPSLESLKKHPFFRKINWHDIENCETLPPVVPCAVSIANEVSALQLNARSSPCPLVIHGPGLWHELGMDGPNVDVQNAFHRFYFPVPT